VPRSARQRQLERLAWDDPNAETAKAEREMENFYESVYRERSDACAAGRGVGEKLKEALSILQGDQKDRDAARTKEEQEASRKARKEEEALRAAQEKARQEAVLEASRKREEARKAADEQAKAAEAAKKATAASSAPVPVPTPAPPARPGAPAARAPAGPGAISGQTSEAERLAEWEGSKGIAQQDEAGSKTHAKPQSRQAKMLVGQVVRVHFVVWERAELVLRQLVIASQTGPEGERAVCATIATQVIDTCATMVDKQPGMAYALSGFVLHVGERCPVLWECLLARLQASCCYCVPYYPDNTTGNTEEFKKRLGYKQGETKKDFYARMAGYVTLYAALLQQSFIAQFPPQSAGNAHFDWTRPDAKMQMRPVRQGGFAPKGVSPMARAWAWLARLLNHEPGSITATILLAFLKPCAHALHGAYHKQFPKLLTFLQTTYIAKIRDKVSRQGNPAEEKAARVNLESWLDDTNALLAKGGRVPEPKEKSDMIEYKPPDDLRDANGGDF
jgi:hypothetical protein